MRMIRACWWGWMLFAACAVQGGEIRRISLDGTAGIAPAEETGKDGLSRIKKLEAPVLELFPAPSRPAQGTVLVCPGGGYGGLAVQHEGRDVAAMLNAAGWDAAVLLYHVSAGPETRALALRDAITALRLLQTRGSEFGLSPGRIGAIGFSAGGHLCARLAHETANDHPLSFVALIYPAYLEEGGKLLDEVAPAKVPAFLYVAEDDKFAPGSFAYAAACQANGIAHQFHHPAQGGHGFGLKPQRAEAVQDWPDQFKGFLAMLPP